MPANEARSGSSITVVLCTHNRCGVLADVLQDLTASRLPDARDWEVLVVDNNSSDQTRQIVEGFRARDQRIRYLFEPRTGKSHALNSGVKHARGEVLAFVDDDVRIDPGWLQHLTAPLNDRRWAGVGGRTLVRQKATLPPWFAFEDFGSIVCAHFDLGNQPLELGRPPYGANMAFRKSMFDKYGGFRTDLGPSPHRHIPRCGEDTDFGHRLLAAGERIRYEPQAVVYHPVPEDRLHPNYILSFWFDHGRAAARNHDKGLMVWRIKRDYLSILKHVIVVMPVNALRWCFSFNPQKRFRYKCWMWRAAGEIAEMWSRSLGIKKSLTQQIAGADTSSR